MATDALRPSAPPTYRASAERDLRPRAVGQATVRAEASCAQYRHLREDPHAIPCGSSVDQVRCALTAVQAHHVARGVRVPDGAVVIVDLMVARQVVTMRRTAVAVVDGERS